MVILQSVKFKSMVNTAWSTYFFQCIFYNVYFNFPFSKLKLICGVTHRLVVGLAFASQKKNETVYGNTLKVQSKTLLEQKSSYIVICPLPFLLWYACAQRILHFMVWIPPHPFLSHNSL